jgi:hypothetical protein
LNPYRVVDIDTGEEVKGLGAEADSQGKLEPVDRTAQLTATEESAYYKM